MIPRKSFLSLFGEIDNGKLSRSVRRIKVKNNKDVENIHHHIHGGIFGITIGAIVAGIAAAASKAAAAAATTAAVIGSSTAATTVATSVAGGIGGALAGAATEAIIKAWKNGIIQTDCTKSSHEKNRKAEFFDITKYKEYE